ncbi:MAG TPA: polyphosphate kinase 1 [Anaerolineales bacterium]|nr:polyphosphate kinase 1 [Anaerolineales bacterium]
MTLVTDANGKNKVEIDEAAQVEYDLDDPELFLNRELSMLQFQWRVFEEAADDTNPLLERVKFLSIVATNLDEFFMVRVGGLKLQLEAGFYDLPPDGMTPAEQLAHIRKEAHRLMRESRKLFSNRLRPELAEQGIHILNYADLSVRQIEMVDRYFHELVFPILTPLAFDPGHPFPHISNLSLNLAITIRGRTGKEHFARVKVPGTYPRLFPLKRSSGSTRKDGTIPFNHYFVWLDQVIANNLHALFPGMEIIEVHPFRVTRNADMIIQELEADDLLETMEKSVLRRRFGDVVRVTINPEMPEHIREILVENLKLDRNDLYVLDGPLGFGSLMTVHDTVERYDLRDSAFVPAFHEALTPAIDGDIFSAIRQRDILLHHPYDSFSPVVSFLERAASDPDVLAIKQTLYRTGSNSPVIETLLKARQNGKQVAVLVELKARFDEESNIEWARKLEQEGVHVTYGLLGLKTHSKIALVIRQEDESIRRYVHLSTGNYNAVTSHVYEDLGLFTCDPDIGEDASDLFNSLTGYSEKGSYRKLLVAPVNLREGLAGLIQREIDHRVAGRKSRIIIKCNHIIDKEIIKLLYRASQAGSKIDLFVRGMCTLRPGLAGVSDNIRVHSIVGRFLEHSRIYYFLNNNKDEIYMGSADLMPRNLNRRVEIVYPIGDPRLVRHIRDEIFEIYLRDNARTRVMQPDGSYTRVTLGEEDPVVDVQNTLLQRRLRE